MNNLDASQPNKEHKFDSKDAIILESDTMLYAPVNEYLRQFKDPKYSAEQLYRVPYFLMNPEPLEWDFFEDRKKNSTTASEATYTANQVQELLQNEINNILQSTDTPTITSPPSPTASANASITADDVRRVINEALANTRSNNNNRTSNRVETQGTNPPRPPTMCQAIVDGVPVSYCWTHGITRNLQHTSSTCKRKSDGHQDDATYYNRKGGNQNTLGQSSS